MFSVRMVRQCNRLPGETVESPLLDVFKKRLDKYQLGMILV